MLDLNLGAAADVAPTRRDVTLNFPILKSESHCRSAANDGEVIEIEDDDEDGVAGDGFVAGRRELQLFPLAAVSSSSSSSSSSFSGSQRNRGNRYWLDLSLPENFRGSEPEFLGAGGDGVRPPVKKSRRGPRSRSSQYRGVTFYRRTGRWESHIWDSGKQVYLGGFDTAHAAARAYDYAAIKFRGVDADINFSISDYEDDMKLMKNLTKEEFVQILRRQINCSVNKGSKNRCGGQSLGIKAYDKASNQCNVFQNTITTSFGTSYHDRDMKISSKDGGSESGLDLKLGTSLSSDDVLPQGSEDTNRRLRFPYDSSLQLSERISVKVETNSAYSGFSPNNKEREIGILGNSTWSSEMESAMNSAASSGFSSRAQFPFHGLR